MFADSLLDSACSIPSRRGWSTLASFALEAMAIATLMLLPLIYTTGLPRHGSFAPLLAPAPAPPRAAPAQVAGPAGGHRTTVLPVAPPRYVPGKPAAEDQTAVLAPPNLDSFSSGSSTLRSGNDVLYGLGSGLNPVAVAPPPAIAHATRVSRMMEGNLIHRVDPEYPALARLARIHGEVVLRAVISKQGAIENLQAVSGPPLLVKAALDAVRQWRYRPYLLNGDAVEVETQVTVNFVLGGG